jgi:hypothetical protein
MEPVTRSEIADHIEDAFVGAGAADRAELIEAARRSGARGEVIATLERLPDRRYAGLRQLWTALPELPVRA